MAACKGCAKEIRWSDTFPGDICVDCHRAKMTGASAESDYQNIMGTFSQTAVPTNFKKSPKRK